MPNQGRVASGKEACPPAPLFFRGSFWGTELCFFGPASNEAVTEGRHREQDPSEGGRTGSAAPANAMFKRRSPASESTIRSSSS